MRIDEMDVEEIRTFCSEGVTTPLAEIGLRRVFKLQSEFLPCGHPTGYFSLKLGVCCAKTPSFTGDVWLLGNRLCQWSPGE